MERNSWTLSEDALGSDGALRSAAAVRMKVFVQHKGLPSTERHQPFPSLRILSPQWFYAREVKGPLLALTTGVTAPAWSRKLAGARIHRQQ